MSGVSLRFGQRDQTFKELRTLKDVESFSSEVRSSSEVLAETMTITACHTEPKAKYPPESP
ncbi:hypothetical protein QUF63_11220 [Anaerolineales bacterium HSG25]|nr:hypothetical protein [Anaerolineales bacterium HSG25]